MWCVSAINRGEDIRNQFDAIGEFVVCFFFRWFIDLNWHIVFSLVGHRGQEETMAPRINSIGLCVIVVLCILLIFASNRISFLSSSASSSADPTSLEFSRTFNLPNDRFYSLQSNGNSLGMNLYANNRAGGKYNKIMHPHNTEQRSQYYYNRRYSGSNTNNNQLNAETATVLTTNNDVIINTTVRIEDVLDAQRQRISMKMKDFEYTEDMQGGLSSLTPETNGNPLRSGKSTGSPSINFNF